MKKTAKLRAPKKTKPAAENSRVLKFFDRAAVKISVPTMLGVLACLVVMVTIIIATAAKGNTGNVDTMYYSITNSNATLAEEILGAADDAAAIIDDVNISLLSGQGTIIKNAAHTKLPDDEEYREGGTVFEMLDGSLLYISKSWNDDTFKSTDSGRTWTRADGAWDYSYGYPQIIRLNDETTILRIDRETIDDVLWWTAQTSTDDGATWTTVGKICKYYYNNITTMIAGNMNDKLTQMSDGRIFYVVSCESKNTPLESGSYVFSEIYYSDDNGATWTKSAMDTFDIEIHES